MLRKEHFEYFGVRAKDVDLENEASNILKWILAEAACFTQHQNMKHHTYLF